MNAFGFAIVRRPTANLAGGLTSVQLGTPNYETALVQHDAYCHALERCGLEVIALEPNPNFPDATFVEDTAVIYGDRAIVTNPGAESRRGEVESVREALERRIPELAQIHAPGTLDGGDVCDADSHVYIGISRRTNADGAAQLARWLAEVGRTSSTIDIRGLDILHLKTGIAYVGANTIVSIEELAEHPELRRHSVLRVKPEESYAADCLNVNGRLLVPAGFPRLAEDLERLGLPVDPIGMSEFEKMDGGLSCLSLRF